MNIYILTRIGPRCVLSKENPTTLNHLTISVNKYLTQTCKYTCVSPTLYCHVSIKWNAEVGLFLFVICCNKGTIDLHMVVTDAWCNTGYRIYRFKMAAVYDVVQYQIFKYRVGE